MGFSWLENYDCFNFLNLKTINFDLDQELDKTLRSKLNDLYERSPSGSILYLELEKRREFYKGALKVTSYGKDFHTTNKAQDLELLCSTLIKELDRQLLNWKKRRSFPEVQPELNGIEKKWAYL